MDRKLDGVFFRMKRGDKFENVCFSDLTDEEREQVATVQGKARSTNWWKALAYHLADRLKELGDFCEVEGR